MFWKKSQKKPGLDKEALKITKGNSELVLFTPTNYEGNVTYGEFYSVDICPKCHAVLDDKKARYYSRCCYKCGHTNCDTLFDTEKVTVRDVYVNGKFTETIVHEKENRIGQR